MGARLPTDQMHNDPYQSTRLEQVFARCFADELHTRLLGGAEEPLYQPAPGQGTHKLYYRQDYFASALHEVAHWCIAGARRREQTDFGYWYAPEGRSPEQQLAFENVEYKPQALEWFFSRACAYPFRISVDNFDETSGELPDTSDFCRRVYKQALVWQQHGLPQRAASFYRALCHEFGTAVPAGQLSFAPGDLYL